MRTVGRLQSLYLDVCIAQTGRPRDVSDVENARAQGTDADVHGIDQVATASNTHPPRTRIMHALISLIRPAMALGSTVYKAELSIADIARSYYADHVISLARHPSETEERLMTRLLAFALHAHEDLKFGRGLSADDEPDLWKKDATGAIDLWIDVGLPEERSVRKACGRARRVVLFAYGGRKLDMWWQQSAAALGRNRNLEVFKVSPDETAQLAALAERSMRLSCTVNEGSVWIGSDRSSADVEIKHLIRASE